MRVIINRSETTLYTQAELDAAVAKARKEVIPVTGRELREAWHLYKDRFADVPHGTEKQLTALLSLVRARVRKVLAA